MIIEDYVSFETAKLLKEKGFNEKCISTYNLVTGIFEVEEVYQDWTTRWKAYVSAPTLQMAMKWLREVHNITIGIIFSSGIILYEIQKNGEFITSIGSSRTYEQMVEEAIQLCVKTLI